MSASPEKESRPLEQGGEKWDRAEPSSAVHTTTPVFPVKPPADFKPLALEWAAAGFRVMPCAPYSHAPLVPHGFAAASSDPDLVRLWWNIWPAANVAVATGRGLVGLRLNNPFAATLLNQAGASPKFLRRLSFSYPIRHHGRVYLFRSDAPVKSRLHVLHPRSHLRIFGEGDSLLVPPSRQHSWTYSFPGRKPKVPPLASLAPWAIIEPYLNGECK